MSRVRTGTSHFRSLDAAAAYYRAYGFSYDDVVAKLRAGEIHIGPPPAKPGDTVGLQHDEGRYFIETRTP
jgi:hypothetical protein